MITPAVEFLLNSLNGILHYNVASCLTGKALLCEPSFSGAINPMERSEIKQVFSKDNALYIENVGGHVIEAGCYIVPRIDVLS